MNLAVEERNKLYHEARAAERARRKTADLRVSSHHGSGDHFATQQEFIRWINSTFGYGTDPMWSSGTMRVDGSCVHHWLLQDIQQVMMAKLAWG